MPAATAPAQLPMPPLQTYVALSFLFLAWSLLQAREGLFLLENMQSEVVQGQDQNGPVPGDVVQDALSNVDPAMKMDQDPGISPEGLQEGEPPGIALGGYPKEPVLDHDADPSQEESHRYDQAIPVHEHSIPVHKHVPDDDDDDDVSQISGGSIPSDGSVPGPDDGPPLVTEGEGESSTTTVPPVDDEAKTVEGAGLGQEHEDLLDSLALDFSIHPDDSDMVKIFKLMLQDSLSVVVVINMAFCCLVLLGKAIQNVIFGDLRVIERQQLRDKLWNFSFYKLIVVFGVLNVQTLEELVLWVSWFAVLAFLHGFAQLSKDRFEYLSFSPTTATKTHSLVIGLLVMILGVTVVLMGFSVSLCYQYDWNLLFFMLAECILVAVRAVYVLARYAIHLYDLNHAGVWENRGSLIYYTELVLELVTLSLDFVHHLHMLLWVNVFLSMASLLICMQLRHLYYEIQRRVQRHRNYRRVVANMEARFPRATEEELVANNDDCAICWEELKGARKLPCGHLFHDACLRSWLEHETSCPTCRQSLNIQSTPSRPAAMPRPAAAMMGGAEPRPNQPVNLRNHFFHFDGSRIFSWLPSFSVEVTHAHVMGPQTAHTSQLDNMARQVGTMFAHIPHRAILEDLRSTRSIELTVDNILEGRVAAVGVPVEESANAVPDTPPADTFPAFTPRPEAEDESGVGLLYRQTRQPPGEGHPSREGVTGEGSGGAQGMMEGTEDNAANWNRPSTSAPSEAGTSGSSDDVASGGFPSYSSRFSKKSSEREASLRQRKEKMFQLARRKFQERQQKESSSDVQGTSSASSSTSSAASSHHQPPAAFPDTSLSSQLQPMQAPPYHTRLFQLSGRGANAPADERQRVRAATLEAALRRLQQQQSPI